MMNINYSIDGVVSFEMESDTSCCIRPCLTCSQTMKLPTYSTAEPLESYCFISPISGNLQTALPPTAIIISYNLFLSFFLCICACAYAYTHKYYLSSSVSFLCTFTNHALQKKLVHSNTTTSRKNVLAKFSFCTENRAIRPRRCNDWQAQSNSYYPSGVNACLL